jgi:uncharacterized membrane protein
MESRAKLAGHALHKMLIVFPLGLLATAAVFDVLHLTLNQTRWAEVAFWMIAAGVLGGLAAAVPGLIDWLAIPHGTRAKRIGLIHGLGNVVVLALFAAGWWLRADDPGRPGLPSLLLSFSGVVLALFTGWLGGELADRLGVGVDDGANLGAPNSLSGRPAHQRLPR